MVEDCKWTRRTPLELAYIQFPICFWLTVSETHVIQLKKWNSKSGNIDLKKSWRSGLSKFSDWTWRRLKKALWRWPFFTLSLIHIKPSIKQNMLIENQTRSKHRVPFRRKKSRWCAEGRSPHDDGTTEPNQEPVRGFISPPARTREGETSSVRRFYFKPIKKNNKIAVMWSKRRLLPFAYLDFCTS